jgi:hypothetical protein
MGDATKRLGARRLYSDEFLAVVEGVLASLPAPLIREADLDAVVAEVVERVIAIYPFPRRRGLIGFRAITQAYVADSWHGKHARVMMGMYQLELRHRAEAHRLRDVAAA